MQAVEFGRIGPVGPVGPVGVPIFEIFGAHLSCEWWLARFECLLDLLAPFVLSELEVCNNSINH